MFQLKCYIYRFLFCKSKTVASCFFRNDTFLKEYDDMQNKLTMIGESLSLKAYMKFNNVQNRIRDKLNEKIVSTFANYKKKATLRELDSIRR